MHELVDQLLADYQKPEDLIGGHGLLKQLQCSDNTRHRRLLRHCLAFASGNNLRHYSDDLLIH